MLDSSQRDFAEALLSEWLPYGREVVSCENVMLCERSGVAITGTGKGSDKADWKIFSKVVVLPSADHCMIAMFLQDEIMEYDYFIDFDRILEAMTVNTAAAPQNAAG